MTESSKVVTHPARRDRRRRLPLAAATVVSLLALAPASAEAAQVTLSGGTLAYQAASGEINTPALGTFSGRFYVSDRSAPLTVSGAGCSRPDVHTVSCPDTSVSRLAVSTGDGNDTIDLSYSLRALPSQLDGGADDDSIKGGAGDDAIDGGSGNDSLRGNGGADTIRGGDGLDTATYAGRAAGVSVSLDGVANDGAPSEGDEVATDVENLTGTDLADTLTGDGAANLLTGGGGPDHLDGGGGRDTLDGGEGNDVIAARDTEADQVGCGVGADSVSADRVDAIGPDCESVELPVVPVVPVVPIIPVVPVPPAIAQTLPLIAPRIALPRKPVAVTTAGDVPLPLACPSHSQAACAGYVELTVPPTASAHTARRGECLRRSCRRPSRPRGGRVGTRHFLVQIGHIVSLRVGLNRYGQWKLRHDGRLKIRVTTYSKRGGKTVRTGSSSTTLLRPRASHHRARRR